jgi:hypothetical protein
MISSGGGRLRVGDWPASYRVTFTGTAASTFPLTLSPGQSALSLD